MYDLMPLFFGGIMFILGLVMVINPKVLVIGIIKFI